MLQIIGTSHNGIDVYRHTTASHSHRPDLDVQVISLLEIPEEQTFYRVTVDCGRIIGEDHLVETDAKDLCVMMRRGNRPGESRFVLTKAAKLTSKATIVLCVDREEGSETFDKWCLVTLFEGKQGEREPFDPSLKTEEAKAASESFWKTHALVPTEEEKARIENELGPFRVYAELYCAEEDGYENYFNTIDEVVNRVSTKQDQYCRYTYYIYDKNNKQIK